MASGKSLELAALPKPTAQLLCTCGEVWDKHFRKDGKGMLKKYEEGTHSSTRGYVNRQQRRSFARNRRAFS